MIKKFESFEQEEFSVLDQLQDKYDSRFLTHFNRKTKPTKQELMDFYADMRQEGYDGYDIHKIIDNSN